MRTLVEHYLARLVEDAYGIISCGHKASVLPQKQSYRAVAHHFLNTLGRLMVAHKQSRVVEIIGW
ncbi:hypothetical protein C9I28_10745 [Pseudoduganella armeniaca]|uniref:Uncharacterized protein n=1 Tax=Pseudoduganella armeniaca TaxID=2072590 RepID=A0A2R4C980_9BURK|nr:hypothetical protein C9I28_10745 [Pseudoduganella armeniaca]